MSIQSIFIYSEEELKYHFHDDHPFNQHRLTITQDLLHKINALPSDKRICTDKVDDDILALNHEARYIETVKALSEEHPLEQYVAKAAQFGLNHHDNHFFPGMHEAGAYSVGGSITAVKNVMSGNAVHALHLGGGLHHAMPNLGSGFCIYNDAAIAIHWIKKHYQAKILYVDTDVHHGDGVQMSFYTDPDVFTYSIHETGKYLFPGSGDVSERGEMDGFGACVNLPLDPYTEDDSWMECFTESLEKTAKHFKPDIIISQHGCDAHAFDPLSHLQCSMHIYNEMPRIIHKLAHEYCEGRWVALGGGGYDIYRVVPRAWGLLWCIMSDHPLSRQLQQNPSLSLPTSWIQQWQPECKQTLPATWLDHVDDWTPAPRRQEITARNRHVKSLALMYIGS